MGSRDGDVNWRSIISLLSDGSLALSIQPSVALERRKRVVQD